MNEKPTPASAGDWQADPAQPRRILSDTIPETMTTNDDEWTGSVEAPTVGKDLL
ncbi:hypothetical protein BAU01nite_35520 [Brevibacterium aurantiacum]|uniref:Uncharacterized protein n=1 Tax=Brevibacterium aurantiacum TaxID=273384 RepID=A0A2H1KPG2_BREAU|nr:hypothetical protein BAU01nite_35520 [Brevibacterium aurantiacum]SMY01617.1 hypothetical protein BAUR9175_03714 [Brevibacterium aurantiacum]